MAISGTARAQSTSSDVEPAAGVIRFATYNTSLYRPEAGQLTAQLRGGRNQQARRLAQVIQRVRPHVLVINEFDYDPTGETLRIFCEEYLRVDQEGLAGIEFPHRFAAPVNTGIPSGVDLDDNGIVGGAGDAIGYGQHAGQYGMAVLSKFPIRTANVRTFQRFLWKQMPGARLPTVPPTGRAFYDERELELLRLASKSFWDVPIDLPAGARATRPDFVVHLLCAHPTPPVFDGPEDRNGQRNYDEIRMIADYLGTDSHGGDYLVDDAGVRGGLSADALFVVAGDLNADPVDGDSVPGAIAQLLEHPRVNATQIPSSRGGAAAAGPRAVRDRSQQGDPAHDTANFGVDGASNLRVDYVLPARGWPVVGTGVYWPTADEPDAEAVTATDHRLVWLDLRR